MDLPGTLLVALGLSLDALAVSLCSGIAAPRAGLRPALVMAAFFGGFQFLMPLLGWLAGTGLRRFLATSGPWIACALLAAVGGKMITDARRAGSCAPHPDPFRLANLFALAVATSIDALAVGVGLSLVGSAILRTAAVIGAVTFALSCAGVLAGRRCGDALGGKAELAGGVILIGLGARILLEHLA